MAEINNQYRTRLIETINLLIIDSEVQLFSTTVYLLMSGELKEIDEVFRNW